MAYTEAELIGQLEKDLARSGELYVKDYIQEGGAASDTGRSYEDIISTYLVSHAEALKMTDTNWGMVHTAIGKTSERGSRMAQKLLSEKDFFHAIPLDGDVRLTDGTMAEIGYFDFMTLDKEGKSLTLFEIRPYPEKEKPLSRLLRCWSLKTSLNKALLLQMLGMEKLPRISIVTLITGGGSDHFTPAGRQPVPLPLKQLGGMLGVFCLYLFHGLYGVPVSGAQAPAQMTRAELISLLEKDAKHPELYPDTSNRPDIIEIGIEAKLAFGTGNHETTRMIISQLLQMPVKTKRVLDCGTGTGILGLTASKLGAKDVVGYDIDEWSVENAKHNAVLNGVENMEVLFGNCNVLTHVSGVFDVVMANINRNILLNDMRLFRNVMNIGGTLILSGFYEEDVPVLLEKAAELGLHEVTRQVDNNWTCLVLG